jgi:hypothetical protein
MKFSPLHSSVLKPLAVLAAVLVLPALAQAQTSNQNQNQNQNGNYPVVPETNTGIVLIPFLGAVLLFSSFRLLRAKAAQKN